MRRIIFVPQYPSKMRYQEWWYYKLPEEFSKRGYEVITLGSTYPEFDCLTKPTRGRQPRSIQHGSKYKKLINYAKNFFVRPIIELNNVAKEATEFPNRPIRTKLFSPVKQSIQFEMQQIQEFLNLRVYRDDILFLSDISFPGFFTNVLYHKHCKHMFAFCHATSLNRYDYFQSCRYSKYQVETGFSKIFDKVFVGSNYHKKKLSWNNTVVTYLPFPPFTTQKENKKTIDIISVARPTIQKCDRALESIVEKQFGPIFRPKCTTWNEYYRNLSMSKVLLVTANEDTFGYQIIDAILNGCIPIARNDFAYPEILPRTHLYSDTTELLLKLDLALNGHLPVPEIKCKVQMEHFYDNIIKEIENAI